MHFSSCIYLSLFNDNLDAGYTQLIAGFILLIATVLPIIHTLTEQTYFPM
jgi:hypothetical protein